MTSGTSSSVPPPPQPSSVTCVCNNGLLGVWTSALRSALLRAALQARCHVAGTLLLAKFLLLLLLGQDNHLYEKIR